MTTKSDLEHKYAISCAFKKLMEKAEKNYKQI